MAAEFRIVCDGSDGDCQSIIGISSKSAECAREQANREGNAACIPDGDFCYACAEPEDFEMASGKTTKQREIESRMEAGR